MSSHAIIPNPLLERARGLVSGGRVRVRCFTAGPDDCVRPNFESELYALVGRRRFVLEIAPLTEPQTFIKALRRNHDEIVHIACHGVEQSLCFLGQNNDSRQVDSEWMIDRFEHARSVKLVVLNACDSAAIATAIAESPRTAVVAAIGYVGLIDEVALCEFTNAFYSALAEGLTVKRAFDDARASLDCGEAARQLRLCGLGDFSLLYNHLVPPVLIPWLGGLFLGALLGPLVRRLVRVAALCLTIALVIGVAELRTQGTCEDMRTDGIALCSDEPPTSVHLFAAKERSLSAEGGAEAEGESEVDELSVAGESSVGESSAGESPTPTPTPAPTQRGLTLQGIPPSSGLRTVNTPGADLSPSPRHRIATNHRSRPPTRARMNAATDHPERSAAKERVMRLLSRRIGRVKDGPMPAGIPGSRTISCREVQQDIHVQRCLKDCDECGPRIRLSIGDDGALSECDGHNASVLECLADAVSRATGGRTLQGDCVLQKY